jgi:adenylosuccinate lyase
MIVLWLARLESRTERAIEQSKANRLAIELINAEIKMLTSKIMEGITELKLDMAKIKGRLDIEE